MIAVLMWALAAAPCHPVEGNRIFGRDLAAASTAFSAMTPDAIIGYAPQPGARRLFSASDLARIARANSLDDPGLISLCFERAAAPLDAAQVQAAMQQSLEIPTAELHILELSKYPVPIGKIVFPRASLGAPSAEGEALWHGFVQFDGGRFPVWARIRLTVQESRIVATSNLKPGQTIQPGDIRLEQRSVFPQETHPLTTIEAALGRTVRRAIQTGSPVTAAALEEAYEISAGKMAVVEVRSGTAILHLEAKAESSGHRGETITLRGGPHSKPFRARIVAPNRALVDCSPLEASQ